MQKRRRDFQGMHCNKVGCYCEGKKQHGKQSEKVTKEAHVGSCNNAGIRLKDASCL